MQLGALISRLESEQDAGDALTALGDVVLYAEVLATGERFDECPAIYTANAVARFASGAADVEWVTLLGAMEKAHEPSQAFLVHVLKWALARDAGDAQPCCGSCETGASPEPHHGTHS